VRKLAHHQPHPTSTAKRWPSACRRPPDLAPRSSGAAPALRPARPCRPVADNHGPPPGPIASPPSDSQPPPRPPCFFGLPTSPPASTARSQSCSLPACSSRQTSTPTNPKHSVPRRTNHFLHAHHAITRSTTASQSNPNHNLAGNQETRETKKRRAKSSCRGGEYGTRGKRRQDLVIGTEKMGRRDP